jgi:hypothetical protein
MVDICWNDTICSTSYGIFDLDTNWWGTSPYVIAWVIHLIILSSCMWGNLLHWWSLKVEDHLWNHRLVWLIPHVEMWYHLEEFSIMELLVCFVNKNHFLNISIFMSTVCRILLVSWSRHHLWILLEKLFESRYHLKHTN